MVCQCSLDQVFARAATGAVGQINADTTMIVAVSVHRASGPPGRYNNGGGRLAGLFEPTEDSR
jgi:hypothetical protein